MNTVCGDLFIGDFYPSTMWIWWHMIDDEKYQEHSHKDIVRWLIYNRLHIIPSHELPSGVVIGDFSKASVLFYQVA